LRIIDCQRAVGHVDDFEARKRDSREGGLRERLIRGLKEILKKEIQDTEAYERDSRETP